MSEVTDFCKQHSACESGSRWASKYETLADVFENCERGDWMIWMLRRAGKIDKPQAVKIACECALRVLPNFEKQNPSERRPRAAIEAALAWIKNQNEETRKSAADAASAASAADAAYAAYAASAASAAELKWQADMIRRVLGNPWMDAR